MASETVKVIVRCRPMNQREKDLKCKAVLSMNASLMQCSITTPSDPNSPPKTFTFDGVYHVDSTTEQIYNDIAYPLVEGVLEGYNGTVFAYGQTGCGKSFTMQGLPQPPPHRGIIPRAFEHVFEAIAAEECKKFLVHASYCEIYNEEIRDLLGLDIKKKLTLKEHPDKGVYVAELGEHPVHDVRECETLMEKGWKNRATGATLMNSDSSRSHSIFTVTLEMMTVVNGQEHIRRGKLNLVDLAGSERQAKTGATGDRLKEATKINLSLSALGNVISALVDGKSQHIPYRDSKLTRLLQDSLGGNTKTLMIACLSPADNNYEETLSTLRYANRAKSIKNKPKINEDPKDTMLREYKQEIERLRQMISGNVDPNAPVQKVVVVDEAAMEAEKLKIRQEYEAKMAALSRQYEAEQRSKEAMQHDVEALKRRYEQELAQLNEKITESQKQKPDQTEMAKKLEKLQGNLVGGEKANDTEFKERRVKRKKAAEKRMEALAMALSKVDEDDGAMLTKVYDDIHEDLQTKTDLAKKYKSRVKALESEIADLQSEFEKDRVDYLETIRKQDQQIMLFQQIMERVQPLIKKDTNYSNLERVKEEAVWEEETRRWRIPEVIITKVKFPPAGPPVNGVITAKRSPGSSQTAPGRISQDIDSDEGDPSDNVLYKRLQKSAEENIAGTYFQPRRQQDILNKVQNDTTRVSDMWRDKAKSKSTSVLNKSLGQDELNGLNSSFSGSYGGPTSNSWSGASTSWIGGMSLSPDMSIRRPLRLQALPSHTNKTTRHRGGKQPVNTMDII